MAQPFGKDNTAYQHGFAKRGKRPAIYWRWRHMIQRCHMEKDKDFDKYGAKGITVCDRWRLGENGVSGFLLWMQDMGPMTHAGASIDRIDGTKGYYPGNCRWATLTTQANNKRTNVFLTHLGQRLTVAQWARIVEIGPKTIGYRLKQGASVEEALTKRPNHGQKLKSSRKTHHDNTKSSLPQTSHQPD